MNETVFSGAAFSETLRSVLRGAEASGAALSGTTTPDVVAMIAGALTVVEPDASLLDHAVAAAGRDRCRAVRGALGDFSVDPSVADSILGEAKPRDLAALSIARKAIEARAAAAPLIAPDSLDLVVLDMVVNRGHPDETAATLAESYRVLRKGGRLVMTVLLADEPASCVPPVAFGAVDGRVNLHTLPLETDIAAALDRADFHGMTYVPCADAAPAALGRAEVRAFVIEAFKGKRGPCLEQGHAVIYRGPFRETWDDDGHHFVRGDRTAVCSKTYGVLMRPPYAGLFIGLPSAAAPPLEEAPPYDCATPRRRDPKVTKGLLKPGADEHADKKEESSCCC